MNNLVKIPTIAELSVKNADFSKDNALMVLLNQEPPDSWFCAHPTAKRKDKSGRSVPALYMPIERVEFLLSRIYQKWWVEVRDTKIIANSVVVTVRLFVKNPITGETEFQDGIGASPIQTDAGASATDWTKVKSAGVQMAAPSAETYAIKDAAEKFGKIFGKDANRAIQMDYTSLLQKQISLEDLTSLFEVKKENLPEKLKKDGQRIIDNKEEKSYQKLFNELQKS